MKILILASILAANWASASDIYCMNDHQSKDGGAEMIKLEKTPDGQFMLTLSILVAGSSKSNSYVNSNCQQAETNPLQFHCESDRSILAPFGIDGVIVTESMLSAPEMLTVVVDPTNSLSQFGIEIIGLKSVTLPTSSCTVK